MTEAKYDVYHSAVLDADADTVWAVMRDVLQVVKISLGSAVENAHWKKGSSLAKVPALYRFTLLPDGEVVNEEVVGRSEHERSLTYRMIGQALSIVDYVATYHVLPVTNDDRSFVEWSREFRVVEDADPGFLGDSGGCLRRRSLQSRHTSLRRQARRHDEVPRASSSEWLSRT